MDEKNTIVLDKERHLKLTLGGMKAFQEQTGKSLLRGFNLADMDETDLAAFVWACLLHEDRALKFEDVAFMLDFRAVPEIMTKLVSAIEVAVPKVTASPNPANPPAG